MVSASETAVLGDSDRFLFSQGSFLGEVHLFLSLKCCRQNPQLAQMLCAALSMSSLGFLTRISVLISGEPCHKQPFPHSVALESSSPEESSSC